jgi:hypothetical protein
MYNYLEADRELAPVQYYDDALEAAWAMGYPSLWDAVELGYKRYSMRQLGRKLGRSKTGLCTIMKKIGIKRRPRGGANRTGAQTYQGRPCRPHGATKRYVRGRACVLCVAEANKRAKERETAKH